MKINFTQKLTDLNGKPIKNEVGKNLTLSWISVNALLSEFKDEQIEGAEKVKRYDLALKIRDKKDVNLESEEISLIKKLVGKAYSPLAVGQAFKMLERK